MSVDILTLRVGMQAPDEVSVSCAEFAGLSLDLLRPSSVSSNRPQGLDGSEHCAEFAGLSLDLLRPSSVSCNRPQGLDGSFEGSSDVCCRTQMKDAINPVTTQPTQHKEQKPHRGLYPYK